MPFLRKLKSNRQVYRFHELMSLKTDRPDTEPTVDDIAVIQYTSGAGEHAAKAVSLSHRNLVANALQIRHWLPESRVGDERILAVWTLGTGLAATVNLAPLLGATVILVPRTDPLTLLQTIKRTKPTFLPGSPRLYQLLSQVPNVRKFGMASIRVCFSGGANLPVEVQESFEKLTKGRVVDAYSTMEAGICIANPLAARKRSGSIGVPMPDVEVRLFDASTGQECAVDEVGEMWIRGPQVSQGYWNNPLATGQAMKDGWFHTGDLAKRDEDGFFYLMEREEDVIHPRLQDDGGQTGEELQDIYPSEIEEVLYELQEVAEVAVTSWREDNGALEIVAFIVPRHTAIGTLEPLDIAHLHDWCRSRLRPDARPTQFKILNKLPHSATGKVPRKALRGLM